MTDRAIFHLVRPDEWSMAVANGMYWPTSLDAEGFVHFSFAEQVAVSANRFYAGERALLAVEVDATLLADLRVEDTRGHGLFPHGYGPVPMTAVVATHRLARTDAGTWAFTPSGEDAAASPDR